MAAASSCERCEGLGKTLSAGTLTNWAKVPSSGSPRMRYSLPGFRGSSPQWSAGLTTTSVPSSGPAAPSPRATTSPEPSEPRITGSASGFAPGYWPRVTKTSRRLRAAARSLTTVSPKPGSGPGASSKLKLSGPPSSCSTMAFIVPPSGRKLTCRQAFLREGVQTGDLAPHYERLHGVCALVGVDGLDVGGVPRDVVLEEDAVAAEDVAGVGADLPRLFGVVHLRQGGHAAGHLAFL